MGKVHASLFSGFGGADLAAHWMGWDNAFWCEINGFCRQVLRYWFPNSIGYENIKETDFTQWRGKVDVLTGGFPCQPFSLAGQRKGAADDRYLWPEMLRAIREIRPAWVIGENVAGILSMVQPASEITVESQASLFEAADKETLLQEEYVVETICRDLEEEGYSVQPLVIPACAVGAPHRRDRVWFVAHANGHDAGGSGYDKAKRQTGSCQESEGKRQRIRGNTKRVGKERFITYPQRQRSEQIQQEIQSKQPIRNRVNSVGSKWNAPYSYNFHGDLSGFCSGGLSQFETAGVRVDSNTCSQRCEEQRPLSQPTKPGFNNRLSNASRHSWRDFPTQSPICRGNDGLPFDVECLTLSLGEWRRESIKGYGNAIVPQVIYEIFKAIETIQIQKNNK